MILFSSMTSFIYTTSMSTWAQHGPHMGLMWAGRWVLEEPRSDLCNCFNRIPYGHTVYSPYGTYINCVCQGVYMYFCSRVHIISSPSVKEFILYDANQYHEQDIADMPPEDIALKSKTLCATTWCITISYSAFQKKLRRHFQNPLKLRCQTMIHMFCNKNEKRLQTHQ